jgi:DNA polymerase III delta prime subunit
MQFLTFKRTPAASLVHYCFHQKNIPEINGNNYNTLFLTFADEYTLKFTSKFLNTEQRDIVKFAMNKDRKLVFIHGPPGTGKTTTLQAILREAVGQGWKVNLNILCELFCYLPFLDTCSCTIKRCR